MKYLNYIVMIILIVGAINWGLVGAFHFNVVHLIFGSLPMLEKLVYIIVGVCGLYGIYMLCQKCCSK